MTRSGFLRAIRAAHWLPAWAPRCSLGHWVRLLLTILILGAIRPPQVLIIPDAPQQVTTTNPMAGVHTRLTDEVEVWKIRRTLQMVREMGTPWIVEFFPWPHIEPEEGAYTWDHSDAVIETAQHQGLTVIARLGWVPGWARPKREARLGEPDTTLTHLNAEHYDAFADFAGRFAARYHDHVKYVIIWNEPNLSFEWGYRPVDPEGYTDLLQRASERVHAVSPDTQVLAGALAPTLEPPGSAAGMSDLAFLDRMYAAGAGPHFDALAAHAYGLTSPPGAAPATDAINFRRVELLREVMVRHGDSDKPVFITEAGWNDHPRWTGSVSPAQRISYTVGAYEWAREHWPWCRCVAMWAFRTPALTYSYHDNYTFVTADFEPKVIYLEVQEYTGNAG